MALTLVLLIYGGVGVLLAITTLVMLWREEWSVSSSIIVAIFFYLTIVLWPIFMLLGMIMDDRK